MYMQVASYDSRLGLRMSIVQLVALYSILLLVKLHCSATTKYCSKMKIKLQYQIILRFCP